MGIVQLTVDGIFFVYYVKCSRAQKKKAMQQYIDKIREKRQVNKDALAAS